MSFDGFKNKEVHIDITSEDDNWEEINEELAQKYIGGRGLGVKYVLDNGPEEEPLSEKNVLCVTADPITGLRSHTNGRLCDAANSSLTGTETDSHLGGREAALLKWTKDDNLIFFEKNEKRIYLYSEDEKTELCDASVLRGLSVGETMKVFKEHYGEQELSVIAIGQAGNVQAGFARFMNELDRDSIQGGTGDAASYRKSKVTTLRTAQKCNIYDAGALPTKNSITDTGHLQRERKKSYGSLSKKIPSNALNLAGKKFGRLTVMKRAGVTTYGRALWHCQCECGNTTQANATSLKRGEIVSCGCLKEQQIKHAREALLSCKSIDGVQIPQLTRKVRRDSGTGYKGVQKRIRNGKERFEVSISVKGSRKYIGTFNDLNDAINARKQAEIIYHQPYIKALEDKYEKN